VADFNVFPVCGDAVTCMISQNTGGATHTAHTCFWDAETDGFTKYRFENPTMVCLTTVYGMGI
jgi:hypothetical protein